MSYAYETQKAELFSEAGFKQLLAFDLAADRLLRSAGAVREMELQREANQSGDSWVHLACVDYLVEIGRLRRVFDKGARQYWVYVRADQ